MWSSAPWVAQRSAMASRGSISPVSVVPAGGDDEQGAVEFGEGFVERGEVEGAGGGGDGDGFGEAEEPGGAGDAVVGVGAADGLYGAVAFAGEEQGELVGLGAAGGDDGVG